MNKTWYADESARRMHKILSDEMAHIIARLCPGHELSHMGINRDFVTEEVQIHLHLNPLGRVRIVPEPQVARALIQPKPTEN